MPSLFLKAVVTPAQGALGRLCTVFSFLALPLALLLFAQWPLRDLVQAYSRQANDMGQIIFAFYIAVAVTAASRGQTHLASVKPAQRDGPRPRWQVWSMLACTVPWAIFMLWSSWSTVVGSVASLERFGDTQNPGYFLIKIAMAGLVLLVLLDGICILWPVDTRDDAAKGAAE